MVTAKQNTAAHDLVSIGITLFGLAVLDIAKARLTQDVSSEHGARLNVSFFEENLQFLAGEWCVVLDCKRKCQPAGA